MLTTVKSLLKNQKHWIRKRECITSFDVTALYTPIPVADVIEVIKRRLKQDTELPKIPLGQLITS